MSAKIPTLLLCLATIYLYVGIGSCFVASPLRHRFSPLCDASFPSEVKPYMSSTDDYDGETTDYESGINYDVSSTSTSEWESPAYFETGDEDGLSADFEELNSDEIHDRYKQMSEEDAWIEDIIDEIHNEFSTLDGPLYDTSFDEPTISVEDAILGKMDGEIAMLVRCNERPDALLIEEGRALAPLTNDERNDITQLLAWTEESFQATDFLRQAVSKMFHDHAVPSAQDGILSMDRASIAAWMTKSLQDEEKGRVSQHDRRVLQTMSDFSEYGSGRLVEENFQNLYLKCLVGDTSNLSSESVQRHLKWRQDFRDAVWRDIRAHGILSPVEEERLQLLEKMNTRDSELTYHGSSRSDKDIEQVFVDECEILDWEYSAPELNKSGHDSEKYVQESSHKLVEMADDEKTPLRIRDGNFVFIDEDSCIGCRQCVNIAPDSFLMMESGRARTFVQRLGVDVDDAVNACPVACMHRVSFQELSRCETARDKVVGSNNDHSPPHHGGHIPLHVARRDSDRNRRTSLYHTLRAKCVTHSDCPKRGCYDCPSYPNPGENPYFIAKHKQAEHIRAQHFIKNGEAEFFRKAVDL